jgi:hypothetical protein
MREFLTSGIDGFSGVEDARVYWRVIRANPVNP